MMLFQQFTEIISELKIADQKNKIVVAVSGGVDSIVLLNLLMRLPSPTSPPLVIAHVNHKLRAESDAEEKFVSDLAKKYEIPFYLHRWPQEKHPDSGVEEAARAMRYTFFRNVMAETKANILMTGHHQDDQVETILMKLARGSSLEQLTGIKLQQPFNQGRLIRPLLSFSKDNIYEYAHSHKLEYVEDLTNQMLIYSRNRFRHEIIPLFQEENTQFNEHLEQFSQDLADLLEIADEPIQSVYQDMITVDDDEIKFNQATFLELSQSMQRALLREVLCEMYKGSTEGYKANYINLIQDWILTGAVNTELEFTEKRRVTKNYEDIIFYIYEKPEATKMDNIYFELNDLNKWVHVSEKESFRLIPVNSNDDLLEVGDNKLLISADVLELPFTIRHRRPGDRMTYQGLNGTKKIKDIFIDEKIAPAERAAAWLVEDAAGNIIWLVNYRKMRLLSTPETDKLNYILEYNKE